jgi:hypothetical protein
MDFFKIAKDCLLARNGGGESRVKSVRGWYDIDMRSRTSLFALLFIAGSLALPHLAHASIPFFGPIIPGGNNVCPAGWGMLMTVINNIIELLLTLAIVFVAPLMIAYAGFIYVAYSGNPGKRSEANKMLTNTIAGIVIALAGWMIVDAIMAALYNASAPGLSGISWSSLITSSGDFCLPQKGALPQDLLDPTKTTPGVTVTPPSGTGGSCTVPGSGPCSLSNLQSSCFGSNAGPAGQICSKESSGDPSRPSGGDKTADGKSYSVGLFQINITNSYSTQVDGQSCANAFTQPCQNSGGYNNVQTSGACSSSIKTGSCGAVSCSQLYNDCVASAQNPNNNINQACVLSSGGTSWGRWRNTATSCGLL